MYSYVQYCFRKIITPIIILDSEHNVYKEILPIFSSQLWQKKQKKPQI